MLPVVRRFASPEPACCLVCRRHATAIGQRAGGKRVVWLCDDPLCLELSRWVFGMTAGALNEVERAAMSDAGDVAGQYLDSIGKTDFATLDQEEWRKFLETFVYAFETAMRTQACQAVYGENWVSAERK